MQKTISIIVPVRNEAELIVGQLERLQSLRAAGHELIVVDGGSRDGTLQRAQGLADGVEEGPAGRSRQMNRGAELATGDVLLFLHIDTELPERAGEQLLQALAGQARRWGWFDVRLSGRGIGLRVVASMMNLRSRLTTVCTGDQALFVERALFKEVGGFPDIALMEDIAISKALRRRGRPARPALRATASSRRWEQQGVAATIVLMWKLRLLYFLGVTPARLAQMYYPRHD